MCSAAHYLSPSPAHLPSQPLPYLWLTFRKCRIQVSNLIFQSVSDQRDVPGVCVCVCARARAEKGMKTTPPLYMTPASIIDIVSAVLDFTHLLISLHHCLSNLCVTFNSKKILKDNTLDKCTCGYNGRPQPHNCLKVWGSIALEEYNMSHMYN